ncbi:efflux RND transporter permease subunit [Ectobacillus panaciterrae]|uniref:efflux RND transporter permease subunit n=1 Tax=Ectobacillus panaciterrae TaxID=363872 RepID=UPI00041C8E7E|nr:efflux RND transporter permease subunit [Ectobacillus panaciterrae]
MSFFTKWSFANKAAVTIMSLLVLIMGIVSYTTLPMEFLPAADQPQVSVVVMGQGMDASSMEKQVTEPIEKAVSLVKGKRNVFSTIGDGFTRIDVFFEPKTDLKEAKRGIQESLDTLTLPQNVMKPNVVLLNTTMIPVADVAITFDSGVTPSNLEFAKKDIIPMFEDIKGVSNVQTAGVIDTYVSIKLNSSSMEQKQVSLESIMNVLQGQNLAVAVGEKTIDGKASNLKVIGNIKNVDDLKKVLVAPNVKLSDVSAIELKKPENTTTRIDGKDGLLLIVTKDSQSNAVKVSHEVEKTTKKVNEQFKGVQSNVIIATGNMVETSVTSMMKEVLLGALFATIVIMLFLRNIRSTFITIVSIPLSLCFTLFLLSRSGITLNILTLGGVAVAVGRLVDDSIVVIENIFRKTQTEPFSKKLIIEATKEVGTAITSSTLTTVAVFLPIGLVSGQLQEFLLPFALTVTYSLLASLVVALTVVPLMSAALLKNAKLKEHSPSVRFSRFLTWSLNHKWVVLLVAFFMFAGSIGAYFTMPKGAVSKSKADAVVATLSYPNETPIQDVKKNAMELEKFILDQKQVKYVYMQIGNSADAAKYGSVTSPTDAIFTIILKDDKEQDAFVEEVNKQKGKYTGAKLSVIATAVMGGGATSITIDVIGDKLDELEKTANDIKNKIKDVEGVTSAETNQEKKKTVYSFIVNQSAANTEQVARQLAIMLNHTPLGTVTVDNQDALVQLEAVADLKTNSDLNNIPIATPAGMVPISKVAEIKKEEKPTSTFHKDGNSYIRITAAVEPSKLSAISQEVNKIIFGDKKNKGMTIPKDVKVYIGGASAQQAEDFTDLFMTMLVSIGLVFLIMVITFKTVRAPIAILFSLPLAAVGAVLGLLISRISVDVTSLLGALMLIGIVVTNAIVLLDRVKQNEEKMIIRDAIVEAAAVRMRPILMTAVATIGAMLPLLFKKAETGNLVSQSLAIVVIGGLSIATLLTLVVIPVVYELLHFRKAKKQRQMKQTSKEINM